MFGGFSKYMSVFVLNIVVLNILVYVAHCIHSIVQKDVKSNKELRINGEYTDIKEEHKYVQGK